MKKWLVKNLENFLQQERLMAMEIIENNYISEFMQVKATDKLVKSSVQKLNIIANLIRKENVNEAILQLEFCKRSASKQLQNILKSAIANSQNNHGLDIDKLYVKEVMIGKSLTLKRSMVRARGRINRIIKPFSKVTIIVEERG
jgi:large subunit ribosomal protein L22